MTDTPFRLDQQTAVVTGACGTLGPVWMEALLDAGARVAALDLAGVPMSAGYKAVAERAGDRLRRYDCDVTNRESIHRAVDGLVSEMGEPAILVNNAGVDQPPDSGGSRSRIDQWPIEEFRRMVEVNLLGTFQVIQVIGGRMAGRGSGSIVNIGSLYASVSPDQRLYDHMPGDLPFLKSPAYGASKAAVVNMTKYFATLWGPRGVRVNTLSPGGVLAGQDEAFRSKYGARVPLGRMAQPGDLKGPLVFLVSRASSYVTGHELRVDGGFTAW
ncbi:MAG: SDR family oxidoreductase [Acidobacteria bacterium]|nr:SDR family oxidoreductase [Acidobacteriota bacterium]